MRGVLPLVLVLAALVGGCDFTPTPPAPPAVAPAPVATPPIDAAVDPVTRDCIAVADHLVDLATAAIASDSERAVQAANHARNVRATAEACTKASWTPAMLACLGAASTQAAAGACMLPK